jgi:hypothetical protein
MAEAFFSFSSDPMFFCTLLDNQVVKLGGNPM